ncbi:MAG: cyanophycin synthetase, partial [Dermatophilaceae bacterium]
SSLPGDYNRVNTALAALAVLATGVQPADVERAIGAGASVPGRMERVELRSVVAGREPPWVYVDFAHTPEAVRATLEALRTTASGRVVAVIGAGGARDRTKRPLMGAAAARAADLVVVTDDNPRDEDPAAIRADLAAGARHAGGDVVEIAGRSAAIAEALRRTGPGDVVAVLGRGHESHQEIAGEFRPLVDRDLVRAAWAAPETWTDTGRKADE